MPKPSNRNHRNRKQSQSGQLPKKYSLVYLLPVIMFLAAIPLFMYQYDYITGLTQYDWYQGWGKTSDMFLHIKMVWSYAMFITILCFLIYMVFSEEIKPIWDPILIPLFLYGGLTFLSALFSINRHYSFVGIHEQFEPVWMHLGYVILVYYAFFILYQEEAVKRLIPWFIAGVTVMAVFGVLQALGLDPLRTNLLQYFILSDKKNVGKLGIVFEKGRTFMSLYNPNYVGYYVVMVVPVLIVLLMHTKKLALRIFYGILAASLVFVLFASQSRAGILVLAATFLVMLLCMRTTFFRNWKLTVGIILVASAVFAVINIMNQNVLWNRMRSMFSASPKEYALEYIEADEDVTFGYRGNEIHFTVDYDEKTNDAAFHVVDGDGNPVANTKGSDGVYKITDDRFPFTFGESEDENFNGFYVEIPRTGTGNDWISPTRQWRFSNRYKGEDDSYYIKGAGSSFFHIRRYEEGDGFLEKNYMLANKRGYIWARTLPLLKKYPLLGSGPDTFVIAYPNDDLVGLYNSGHDMEVVTKPHCMYLQIAVLTGIPSLLAFLAFFGWYFVRSLRLYWKRSYDGYMPKMGLAVMVSVLGYLILGLTNDSSVVVSTMFFALVGMGLGINRHVAGK